VSDLDQLADRLEELARQLRDSEIDEARAQELAKEAADVAAEAGDEVTRRLQAAAESADDDS
jgi:hypothetical protein